MANLSLQEIILKNVVIHYIDTPEPIGSKQLKSSLEVDVSPATIRNYFKKLVEQGYLDQLHSSSGRVPTSMAFKEYWNNQIDTKSTIHIESFDTLEKASKFFGVYSLFKEERRNQLRAVYNIEESYLLLVFERGETIIKNSKLINAFLNQFDGYDIKDIYQIARENSIGELTDKLGEVVKSSVVRFNQRELISFSDANESWSDNHFGHYYDGDILDSLEDGICYEHFAPKDHMVIKSGCSVDGVQGSMLIVGHMSRDFNHFLSSI